MMKRLFQLLGFLLGSCISSAAQTAAPVPDTLENEPFEVWYQFDEPPGFQGGGAKEFRDWLMDELYYTPGPADTLPEGRMVAMFMVTEEGKVSRVEVVKSLHPVVDSAVVRRISVSPLWEPGKRQGKPVPVRFTIPVDFSWETAVFARVEQMPRFQEGDVADFRTWVTREFQKECAPNYPVGDLFHLHGRVTVAFTVGPDGSVADVKVLSSPDRQIGEEVAEVIRNSPRWTSGSHHGHSVVVRYIIPVSINK